MQAKKEIQSKKDIGERGYRRNLASIVENEVREPGNNELKRPMKRVTINVNGILEGSVDCFN